MSRSLLIKRFRSAGVKLVAPVIALVSSSSVPLLAQDYPTKPVRMVVGNAPGGGSDIQARIVAQKLGEALGKPVLVDNRAGGTGAVGSAIVARAPADGYTLLLSTSSLTILPNVEKDVPYHPLKDFAAVSQVSSGPNVMVVHPAVSANSVKELVALAKARPGALNYGSAGIGGISHMAAELFKSVTGTNIVHVPYKGGLTALTDLLGGQLQVMFSGPGAVIQQIHAGKLRALAVANIKRAAGLEDVPTFDEAGYPAVKASNWFGVLTTAGTSAPVIARLNSEIVRIVNSRETQARFLASGYNAVSNTPQEFAQFVKDDFAKWQKVVKSSGLN